MPKFMLLLHEQPADFSSFSPEDIQAVIEEYSAWTNKFATGGSKLKDEGGKHISMNGDDIRITDGPYAEAKEVIGGILEIEAADYGAAAEICKSCPHLKYGGRIELREIDPV